MVKDGHDEHSTLPTMVGYPTTQVCTPLRTLGIPHSPPLRYPTPGMLAVL